ncbi:SusC/RagA family TonB-linked outer membrane protein [Rhizosphaericola mali]|uniref:SusC/RagA family TonB-linked outer membrane protein n=1 Tax=Rhizosphaericola mali TaxID=2545455 RepID=A0A5P2G9Z8_9BACT|nr:SusC/RagA family TonB-linked outer membrane protein [Rhizosphaericola mali]QES88361.1 SusC/RagA family TonB-linked outer membrane protein [Rhizosphaericola mali]
MDKTILRKLSKAAFIALLMCSHPAMHTSLFAQEQNDGKIPLSQAVETIEKKYGYHFVYEHNLLKGKTISTTALKGRSPQEILKNVLYPNNLIFLYIDENSYVIQKRTGEIKRIEKETPQKENKQESTTNNGTRPIGGIVTDNDGTPLQYVNVFNKSKNIGTQSAENGKFFLSGMSDGDSIVFNIIGYKQKIITLQKSTNYIDLELSPIAANLNEVSVVSNGLQNLPKERATGAYSVVTAKDLEKIPTNNVIQRLEGLVPGLKVNVLAGDRSFTYAGGLQIGPNSGTRSVGTNDYSATIRGTSTVSSVSESSPLVVVDGAIADIDISEINPNDIDNITFLKDAAAASIWGVRAANGVFVITTKKGKSSSPKINASVNYMIANRAKLSYMKLMNSSQMLDYEKELVDRGLINQYNFSPINYYSSYYPQYGAKIAYDLKTGAINQATYDQQVDSLSKINSLDQEQKYLMQPASSQSYNLSISGGTEKSSYFYSASYSKELPNFKRNIGQRLTVTLNNSWKLLNWATLSTNIRGAFFKVNLNSFTFPTLFRPGQSTLMPYQLLKDPNGNNTHYNRVNPAYAQALQATSSKYQDWTYSYLDELNNNDNTQSSNNYTVNINLKMPIYRGLSGNVLYTNERQYMNSNIYYNPQTYYYRNFYNSTYNPTAGSQQFDFINGGGILTPSNTQLNNYALRGQLAYDGNLGQDHQLNIIAGSEIRQTRTLYSTSTLYDYNPISGFSQAVSYAANSYINAMGYATSLGGAPTYQNIQRRYLSYFSNGSYTYRNKYTLSASVRYDDYNNFGLDKKYRATPLWSSGLKWDVYKEHFMENIKWIDMLSVRGTFGVNGNISTTLYPYTNIGLGSDYTTNLSSATITALANPQLRWEKTYVTNVGIDFSILKHLITGGIDLYTKNGRDLLYSFPINSAYAGTIGGNLLTRNAASMNGKGVDVHLNFNIIDRNDWNWSTGLILSYNTNKIVDNKFDTSNVTPSYINYSPAYITNVKGYATDMIFAFKNAGLDANGQTLVYNNAGAKVPYSSSLSFKDLVAIGRRNAPYFGSWNSTLRYKSLSLYILATYQFGGHFIRPVTSNYITAYYNLNYDDNGMIAQRWKQSGDEDKTNVPGLNGTATAIQYSLVRYQNSDINILSSDYIRLREVSLSYQIPTTLIPRKIINSTSFTFAVRNLGLLWRANKFGYDPDFVATPGTANSLPAATSYNFSLNLNF